MATLVTPSVRYEKSYREALAEVHGQDRTVGQHLDYDGAGSFEEFVRRLVGYREGRKLPDGFVPESVFWLVDDGEYIGRVSIRHKLTPHLRKIGGHIGYQIRPSKRRQGYGTLILRLALNEAKALGLERVFITCDETNIGSRTIIEQNGGVFEGSTPQGDGKPKKLRFWIDL